MLTIGREIKICMVTIDKESLNRAWYQASLWTAVVAGVFILVIAGLIVANYFLGQVSDPINSEELTKLKTDIFRQPKNEPLKEQMRQLDLRMREEYFRRREFSRIGSYLLIGGVVVFLISAKFAYDYRKELYIPTPSPQISEARIFKFARWAVGSFGLAVLVGAVILMVLNVGYSMLDIEKIAKAIIRLCSDNELRKKMGENGFNRVANLYGYEKCVDSYRTIYQCFLK